MIDEATAFEYWYKHKNFAEGICETESLANLYPIRKSSCLVYDKDYNCYFLRINDQGLPKIIDWSSGEVINVL